eukprot:TRINITY_DN9727_c0_g1_i4.p3 TRINITY_DN9727_c0_g1~~TRINITY_DN9727_c0_g1_i4.p3  ORF type:complete len:230 (-),score=39.26 TRINITY_DN9727_c0_g1_i4:721-1410(-)
MRSETTAYTTSTETLSTKSYKSTEKPPNKATTPSKQPRIGKQLSSTATTSQPSAASNPTPTQNSRTKSSKKTTPTNANTTTQTWLVRSAASFVSAAESDLNSSNGSEMSCKPRKNYLKKYQFLVTSRFFEDDQYPACLLWNYEEVLDVVHEFNVVVATFAGHAHTNSHQIDLFGVHHVALPSMLETLPGNDCFGWIDFYEEGVELVGYGEMDSVQIGGRTRRVQEQALV